MTLTTLIPTVLVAMLVVMGVAWVVQRATQNGGWVDVFWTYGTGACGVACALIPPPDGQGVLWRQLAVAALAAIWSLRLGTYVALRVAQGAEDARYAQFRRDWGATFQRRMMLVVLPQAPATALLCLSIALAARQPEPDLRWQDLAGFVVLALAIAGETFSDRQLAAFKASHPPKGAICETGLWGWSRHPNYFFEWFGWLAYPLIAVDPAQPWTWLSLAGPALMLLILTRLTGIPPLEEAMLASRGDAFRDYQRRVSAFIPLPPRSRA